MALNTARISEGLLSLRFPRTRLFAASAPVCIQALSLPVDSTLWLVTASTVCVGSCQGAACAMLAAVCCKATGLRTGVMFLPTGGAAHVC